MENSELSPGGPGEVRENSDYENVATLEMTIQPAWHECYACCLMNSLKRVRSRQQARPSCRESCIFISENHPGLFTRSVRYLGRSNYIRLVCPRYPCIYHVCSYHLTEGQLQRVLFFRTLAWNDSPSNFKAAVLTGPLVRQLTSDGSMSGPLAAQVMTSLLQGLQLHGQHEVNQAALTMLGAQLYDLLRPRFIEVLEVRMRRQNC